MPCYHPITAFRPSDGGPIFFDRTKIDAEEIQLPCGQCHGCRIRRSTEWAIRCIHEAQMHDHNCVVTLTYDDQHLPQDYSLRHYDVQCFIKRLRRHAHARVKQSITSGLVCNPAGDAARATIPPRNPTYRRGGNCQDKINTEAQSVCLQTPRRHADVLQTLKRAAGITPPEILYYSGGEYGEIHGRPHYHAAFFGIDFYDRIYREKTRAGTKVFTSPTLDKLWGMGFASVGDLNFQSAAYIARYIMKKRTGDARKQDYEILDIETGELQYRKKEYNAMSRRRGIGHTWLQRYQADIYPHGKVIARGKTLPTPRYYDKKFADIDQLASEQLQYVRYVEQLARQHDHTPARLAVQEEVAKAKTKSLLRRLEQ